MVPSAISMMRLCAKRSPVYARGAAARPRQATTAIVLGRRRTKALIIALVAIECALLLWVFGDPVLAAILGVSLIWLLADFFVIFRDHVYTVPEMRLFGIVMNFAGYGTILWALHAGTFSRVV